jgi:hypothetical protein
MESRRKVNKQPSRSLKGKEVVVTVDAPEANPCDDPPNPTNKGQVQATSPSSMALEKLITSLGDNVSAGNSHRVPSLGVTAKSWTRSRNQRQNSSGGRVPPSPANS